MISGKRSNEDILKLVEREQSDAEQRALRALIIQPGALGDCILTLPLAHILLKTLGVGGVDILGHMDTLSLFPERTCIHSVRSLESVPLHRLFVSPSKLELQDHDPLIYAFADYTWILSFMGEPDSHFEKNLVYIVHCSHGAEISTLALKAPADYPHHITAYYLEQFAAQNPTLDTIPQIPRVEQTIHPTPEDLTLGRELIQETGVEADQSLVLLHPGSGGQAKCWHLDNFLAVAEHLQQAGHAVLFVVGPVEQERWTFDTFTRIRECAPLLAELSLPQILGVLSNANAIIANDSGISHLSAGMGIPTLTVFGPTAPERYRPIGPKVQIISDPEQTFARKPSVTGQTRVLGALQELLNQDRRQAD